MSFLHGGHRTVSGIEDKLARLVVLVRDGITPGQQLDVATAEVGS